MNIFLGRSHSIAALVLLLGMIGGGGAKGQTFTPAPHQYFSLDLDTKDGNFSNWDINDVTSLSGLRASVGVSRLGKHDRWLPYFLIKVVTRAGQFGLALEAADWKPPVAIYTLVNNKKAERIGEIAVGQTVNVELNWSRPGALSVRAGSAARQLSLPSAVTKVGVSASTGELNVHSIALGTFAQ